MNVCAVVNLKGGSGKTTSVVAIAEALAQSDVRVLCVDLDPQGTLSKWISKRTDAATQLLTGDFKPTEHIHRALSSGSGHVDVVTANRSLSSAEDRRASDLAHRLEAFWRRAEGKEDVILVDVPPHGGPLVLASLMASETAIAPVEAAPGALDGFQDTTQLIRQIGGASLESAFACRVDVRISQDRSVAQSLLRNLGPIDENGTACRGFIRETVQIREAQAEGRFPAEYASQATAVSDYAGVASEIATHALKGLTVPSPENASQVESEKVTT